MFDCLTFTNKFLALRGNSTTTEIVGTSITDVEDGEDQKENVCDTLLMCIVTTLNQGLRNGGGIGDVLRPPSKTVWFTYP